MVQKHMGKKSSFLCLLVKIIKVLVLTFEVCQETHGVSANPVHCFASIYAFLMEPSLKSVGGVNGCI